MRLFHVSSKDLGERVTFVPRIPPTGGPRECKIRLRVCVATTLRGCLLAINGTPNLMFYSFPWWRKTGRKPLVAYEFRGKPYTPTPDEVPDVEITGERWLLETAVGTRLGYISMNTLTDKLKVRLEASVEAATYRKKS